MDERKYSLLATVISRDTALRRIIMQALTAHGYETVPDTRDSRDTRDGRDGRDYRDHDDLADDVRDEPVEPCHLVVTDAVDQIRPARRLLGPAGVLLAVTGSSPDDISAALTAGADDVVTRDAGPHVLAVRIQLAARRTNEDLRVRAVIDAAPFILFYNDPQGVIRLAGGRALESLRLSAEHLIGLSFFELFEDQPDLVAGVRRALSGETFRTEVAIEDRQIFDTNFAPVNGPDGTLIGVVLTLAAMSDQVKVKEELRSFRTFIDSSPDAICVHRFGRLIYVNRTAVALLGYAKAGDLLGRPMLALVAAEDRDSAGEHILQASEKAEVFTQELRLVRADRSQIITEMRTIAVLFEREPAIMAVARDISERKRLQAQLVVTDRLASLGTLAAGIAHEINNPLAFMSANLHYVSEVIARVANEHPRAFGADDPRELAVALKDTADGSARIGEIVKSLSFFTRTEDEPDSRVELAEVLDNAVRMAWSDLRHVSRVVIDYQTQAVVYAEYSRLSQVFFNLLVNAAQAMASKPNQERVLTLVVRTHESDAIIEVTDTGPGIPPEIIGNIFDPFFSTKPVGKGTGLGLSVCYSSITSLGGAIAVANHPEGGCTFSISLPLASDASSSWPMTRQRVLFVENDMWTLRALLDGLRGHELVIATHGEAAGGACRERAFQLLVVNVNLADVAPATFITRLANTHAEATPDVMCLVSASEDGARLSPWRWATKPLTEREIAALRARLNAAS